jgi:hypothetical protein
LGEAAEGGELVEPLLSGVGALPGEAPLFRLAEAAGLPDPVGDLREQWLVGVHGRSSQQAGVERGTGGDPLESFSEGVDHLGRQLGDVVEGSESAAGPEHLGRLGRTGDGVHPVPGGAGDDLTRTWNLHLSPLLLKRAPIHTIRALSRSRDDPTPGFCLSAAADNRPAAPRRSSGTA